MSGRLSRLGQAALWFKLAALHWVAQRTAGKTDGLLIRLFRLVGRIPGLRTVANAAFIDAVTSAGSPRPLPFSLWGPRPGPADPDTQVPSADYVSWTGLVDRSFTGRHLPECDDRFMQSLPDEDKIVALFRRGPAMIECSRSSVLFCFFAQWFTDSILRTDPVDYRRNTSNQEIDLCQIYGLTAGDTRLLREGRGGRLKCEHRDGAVFPARLFDPDGGRVATAFEGLSYIDPDAGTYRNRPVLQGFDQPGRRRELFASGLERGNSTIYYSALSTLFLREHNRLCAAIAAAHPRLAADDDRIFEHARNTNITLLLKIVVEDYINHLSSLPVPVWVDVGQAERKPWYRTNRISAEFDLLYRWHGLAPDLVMLGSRALQPGDFRFNNDLLVEAGVETVLADAAQQPAGRICLHNTPRYLIEADRQAIRKSRGWKLRGYNDYREAFGMPRLQSLTQLTGDPDLAGRLETLYGGIDQMELYVGLLAEARPGNSVLGELMGLMVGVDAFSQALTNPLLSANVFGEAAFTSEGLACIEATRTLDDLAQRNLTLRGRHLSFHY